MQSSRNHFTPFLPDVPVTRLPDYVKPRRCVDEATKILMDGHTVILRAVELAMLSAFVVIFIIAAGARLPL